MLTLRMSMMLGFGKPALRTGRPLALTASVLPHRDAACRHHGMIHLRAPGRCSLAGTYLACQHDRNHRPDPEVT